MKGSRTLCTLAGYVTTTTAFSPDDQSGVTRDGRPLLKYLRLDSNQHCRGSEPRASYQLGYVGKIESPIVTHRRGCVCPLSTGPVGGVLRGPHPGVFTYSWLRAPRSSSLIVRLRSTARLLSDAEHVPACTREDSNLHWLASRASASTIGLRVRSTYGRIRTGIQQILRLPALPLAHIGTSPRPLYGGGRSLY